MWIKFVFINLLLFLVSVQMGFSQILNPAPKNNIAISTKYNQTLLGKNTFVFNPAMNMDEVQLLIDSLHSRQTSTNSEFSQDRYALLFKPGTYHLNIRVGYYMHVMGLGQSPEDVVIMGSVSSISIRAGVRTGHVLTNFWRSAENLTIIPTVDSTNTWAVSQAAPLRRVHVKGHLQLFDGASSGGFMANCKIDGTVFSGSQQQWLTRNTFFNKWDGGVWNMMFVGVTNAPKEDWPNNPVTTIKATPGVREKPYWTFSGGKYFLKIPAFKKNSTGIDWDKKNSGEKTVSINAFYIVRSGADNAKSINNALEKGKHILFTPGIYTLSESLHITRPGTIVAGIGMATLVPENGNMVIDVDDVDGVTIAGLLIDAASIPAKTLLQIGKAGSKKSHAANPIFLFDVFFRVGGAIEGAASNCFLINSNNVFVDHLWLWRADHGNGVGWDKNKSANGLIVNGDNVTIYGLFNEHFQEYQTIWNGEKGKVYFYQSEMPYDPPSNDAWKHGSTNGYASYKVADHVKNHMAWGVGIYGFFNTPLIVDQVIETPTAVGKNIHHNVLILLGWNKETNTVIKSIINGKGGGVDAKVRKRVME
jgi:hypothetical protein